MVVTLSLVLMVLAVICWFVRSIQAFFNLSTRLEIGWLGLFFWGMSLLVK